MGAAVLDHLPFKPRGSKREWIREKLEVVPTYLFRVYTTRSSGSTSASWVRSHEASHKTALSTKDIFDWNDDCRVASMVYQHLRNTSGGVDDNLVSWTSSLLYALQYMRLLHSRHRCDWKDMRLAVVATSRIPGAVFIRDMDLIDAFSAHDSRLQDFASVRRRKHSSLSSFYYFGEYLSQGALQLEGSCRTVSARDMIDMGLLNMFPEMQDRVAGGMNEWTHEILKLREGFSQPMALREKTTDSEIRAALAVGRLFGPYRLPVTANLLGSLPRQAQDEGVLVAFKSGLFSEEERELCSPMRTIIVAYETLPEVQQFEHIRRLIFSNSCLAMVKECIVEVELKLRHSIHYILCATPGVNQTLEVGDQVTTMKSACIDIHQRLAKLRELEDELASFIPGCMPNGYEANGYSNQRLSQ